MVRFTQNLCSCDAETNCARILAGWMFEEGDVSKSRRMKITKCISRLKSNINRNNLLGKDFLEVYEQALYL